jgi:hypothetical protein
MVQEVTNRRVRLVRSNFRPETTAIAERAMDLLCPMPVEVGRDMIALFGELELEGEEAADENIMCASEVAATYCLCHLLGQCLAMDVSQKQVA